MWYRKAILAAILAALTAFVTQLVNSPDSLSAREWVVLVVSAVVAGLGVFVTGSPELSYAPPNRTQPPTP